MVIAGLLGVALGSASVLAHEEHDAGSSVEGTVVWLKRSALTVKTEAAEVRVTLGAKTQIVSGSKPLARAALVPGSQVDVHGNKLLEGGFPAKKS